MPVKPEQLEKLIRYIEENVRASTRSGLRFVDRRRMLPSVSSRQNHVIFGRRGSGKSSLLGSLERSHSSSACIRIDMEDLKSITFPNILIHSLFQVLVGLRELVRKPWWWRAAPSRVRLSGRLTRRLEMLQRLLEENDEEVHRITDRTGMDVKAKLSMEGVSADIGAADSLEVSKEVRRDKLQQLYNLIPDIKRLVADCADLVDDKTIFLILDDYYFIRKSDQAHCVDYFHRLTKEKNFFIKVATIKHRTKLYTRDPIEGTPTGVEIGADVLELDLDYTLDRFAELESFMRQIVSDAAKDAEAELDISELFAGQGFAQLCLASGGVPRDFLNLFIRLGARLASGEIPHIGKTQVTEAAIEAHQGKFSSLAADASSERDLLEHYLELIKAYVYSRKRTNAFLVSKDQMAEFPHEGQAIRELVDLRFLHLVDGNTSSAPSDGKRYEAYILDLGLYDNSRPRHFRQVEPGSTDMKSRKDEIRASPRLDLERLRADFKDLNLQTEMESVEA